MRRRAGDGRGYRTPIDYSGIYVPNQSSELSLRYLDNYNIQFLNPPTSVFATENFQQNGLFISLNLWLGFTTWPMRFLNPLSPFSAENLIFIKIPREGGGIELMQLETVSDSEQIL